MLTLYDSKPYKTSVPNAADQPKDAGKTSSVKKPRRKRADAADFYRLAAALANPEAGEEQMKGGHADANDDLAASEFLDTSFQEKSPLFFSAQEHWQQFEVDSDVIAKATGKWQALTGQEIFFKAVSLVQQRNCHLLFSSPKKSVTQRGIEFSVEELRVLLSSIADPLMSKVLGMHKEISSAAEFHETVLPLMREDRAFPVLLAFDDDQTINQIVINRARHFSSLRLHMKSLQVHSGADPLIRYFHAALRFCEDPQEKFDIFYWLKFDEHQNPKAGEFIDSFGSKLVPRYLFCPYDAISRLVEQKEDDLGFSFGEDPSMALLLKMYLESAG